MDDKEAVYFDFSKKKRDSAIGYFLDALVRSDESCEKRPREARSGDEDVKVYLAHLLFAASTPRYRELVRKYLGNYHTDVARLIEGTDERYIRYFIYKINADHLLLRLGVFGNGTEGRSSKAIFERSENHYQEIARSYYGMAADHHRRIYRKKTAVGEVLEKLAAYFTMYCYLLRTVRRDFFDFANRSGEGAFSEFVQGMNRYEKKMLLQEKQDQFLDLYLEWLKSPSKGENLRDKINILCKEIEQLDPRFRFRIEG